MTWRARKGEVEVGGGGTMVPLVRTQQNRAGENRNSIWGTSLESNLGGEEKSKDHILNRMIA